MSGGIGNMAVPGLIGRMGAPEGQGTGILGGIGDYFAENGAAMSGLGLGLMSGNMEQASQGYMQGQRQDTLRRQQKLLQDQEAQKRTAAQALVQKYNIPPELATDPDTVLGIAKSLEVHRLTPKEAKTPQIFGGGESGYFTLGPDGQPRQLVPGAGPKPAAPPAGYRWADGGALEAIPGGPGDKPTEGQSNAALYAQRMVESDAILSDKNVSAASQSRNQRGLNNIPGGNSLVSQDFQKAEQAQRNFINAALRRESGAVISPQEFENAKLQYFPQPGDGPKVLEQKAENRRTAIQGITNAAGPALKAAQGGAGWTDVGNGVKIRRK